MTRIALLSHRGGNIGHDFMAIGMEAALKDAFGPDVQIDHFEQHNHFEVYPEDHWLRLMHKVPHGRFGLVRRYLNSPAFRARNWPQALPLEYNLAVSCGGPNIVPGGHCAPELGLMLHHLNGAFHYRGVPLIDAGVGASFPFEKIPDRLEAPADRTFYSTALEYVARMTVRDIAAERVVRNLGFEPDLIPCGAIGSGRVFGQAASTIGQADKYVAINFQRVGANTDWGQNVDAAQWMRTMQAVITDVEKRHPVMIMAHNTYELKLAAQLAPHVKRVLPTTTAEYAQTIATVKAGIVSRIHAAIPLAGIGIPSVVVGTDTRMGTIDQFGLPTRYVKQASAEWLIDQLESLIARAEDERQRLISVRESTLRSYANLFHNYARTL
jgi:hypothetical protein